MPKKIDNLIAKELSGNASEQESAELHAWLAESEKNKIYFAEAKNIWNTSRNLRAEETSADVEGAWQEFRVLADREIPLRERILKPVYLRAAAAVFLFVSTFFLVRLLVLPGTENTIAMSEIVAEHTDTFLTHQVTSPALSDTITGETLPAAVKKSRKSRRIAMIAVSSEDSAMVFILPDNSKVYLNKHSKLIYPEKFRAGDREVYLSGEAYFENAAADGNFYVYCHDIRTRMMGSAVNIKGLRDGVVEISAVDGVMEVSLRNDRSRPVLLVQQGEQVVYNKASHEVSKSKVTRKDKWWKRGSFRMMIREFFNRIIHPKEYREKSKSDNN